MYGRHFSSKAKIIYDLSEFLKGQDAFFRDGIALLKQLNTFQGDYNEI